MRAKLAALRIARLPTTATSADDREESPTVNPGPRRISRHWSRHLAAKRASFGSWDLRTNWGMMSLWLLWTAYQVVMTLVRLPWLSCLTPPTGSRKLTLFSSALDLFQSQAA